jgi:histidyl-tRNA synthetase
VPLPGIGFALSIERLLSALAAEGVELPISKGVDCYVVTLGEAAKDKSVSIVNTLRAAGFVAEKDYQGKKVKAQFKAADRHEAKYVIVLGDDELQKNVVNVKDMQSGEQVEVSIDSLVQHLEALQR